MEVFLSACLLGSVILSKMERIKKKKNATGYFSNQSYAESWGMQYPEK